MIIKSSPEYWDSVFNAMAEPQFGWREDEASLAQMREMLQGILEGTNTTVFIPGVGTSILVDELLLEGCRLLLNDISKEALNRLKTRIGKRHEGKVEWLLGSVSRPLNLKPVSDVWIDKAVLHFLLDEKDIRTYFRNLHRALKPGGSVLFAEHSLSGVGHCAGLPLRLYSVDEFSKRLGQDYTLLSQAEYIHFNPAGLPRPYIYALFRRRRNIAPRRGHQKCRPWRF